MPGVTPSLVRCDVTRDQQGHIPVIDTTALNGQSSSSVDVELVVERNILLPVAAWELGGAWARHKVSLIETDELSY